jgi:hypothetical protein
MTKYDEYLERKRKQFGESFDSSDLATQFVPFFNSQARIAVEFHDKGGEIYEVKRGRIGVTTGWKPAFLLMLTTRSTGSSYVLHSQDTVMRGGQK